MRWLVQQLASVRLTIILLVLIGLACLAGTLVPQAGSINMTPTQLFEYYSKTYGAFFHRVFNALSVYRLFSSWWFSALLVLLAVNMMVCSLKRFRLRRDQLGFQMTHLSIIFLLIGVIFGLNGREGQMQVWEGEQSSVVMLSTPVPVANSLNDAQRILADLKEQRSNSLLKLDFAIHLDDFIIERHTDPLDEILFRTTRREMVENPQTGRIESRTVPTRPRSFNLAQQKRFMEPAGRPWDVEVLDLLPLQKRVSRVVESNDPASSPAIELELRSGSRGRSGWLFGSIPRSRLQLMDGADIEYVSLPSRAALERRLADEDLPTTITPDILMVTVANGKPTTLPVRVGVDQPIAGTSMTATVLRFFPDFKIDTQQKRAYSASNHRHNPAIQVRVRKGALVESQWKFSRMEGMPGFDEPLGMDGTTVSLRFMEGRFLAPHYLRILDCEESGDRYLQQYVDGKLTRNVAAAPDLEVEVVDNVVLRLLRWFDHAETKEVEELDPDRVAARLRFRNRRTGKIEEEVYESGQWHTKDQLEFAIGRRYPISQFVSKVRVIEDGEVVTAKTIQMNDPLMHRGYMFSQSSYDSDAGDASPYTVLAVKRDPGVLFIYLGFGILTAGLIIVFYVNPFLRKRTGEIEA